MANSNHAPAIDARAEDLVSRPADAGSAADEFTDFSQTPRGPKKRRTSRRALEVTLRIIGPVFLVGVWQLFFSLHVLNADIFSSPSQVLASIGDLWREGELAAALEASLRRAGLGLLLGLSVGMSLGLVTGLWKIGERLLDASLQMLRTIPFIALGPLFLVWFGLDETPKVLLVAAACVFPSYINTYSGVRSVDPKLIESGNILGLSRAVLVTRVVVPMALPAILTGIRYSMGVAVLALVFAEQINASSGIGFILTNAANNELNMPVVMACIVIYAVLGILVDVIVRVLETLLLPWRPTGVAR